MKILCFDIGCTDIKYGVIEDGSIIMKNKTTNDITQGLNCFVNNLNNITNSILQEFEISYVGVSCAGSINLETGQIIVPPDHALFMDGFNFKDFFKTQFMLDCYADNDVNCFGLAEGKLGKGRNYENFLMITVGTGIGGAITFNKELIRGRDYNAGEFGRMLIQDALKFEDLASTSALVRSAKKCGLEVKNGEDVFQLYDSNNELAKKVVHDFYHNLAIGVANLVFAFNPESLIIGGGITNRNTFILELNKELRNILHPKFYDTVKIECSDFKNDGGILGAYCLVKEKVMKERSA